MVNEKEIVIDATGATLGRLASFAAKQALLGNNIAIINSEKAIITGNKKDIFDEYIARRQRGKGSAKAPIFPSKAEHIVKRTVRGMLAHKKARGNDAFKRVRCYEGTPKNYESGEKLNMISKSLKSITIRELSTRIGKNPAREE